MRPGSDSFAPPAPRAGHCSASRLGDALGRRPHLSLRDYRRIGCNPASLRRGGRRRDLLFLAPVRAALHVLFSPHWRNHHRQPELRRRAHRAHPRTLWIQDRPRLQFARRTRSVAWPEARIESGRTAIFTATALAARSSAPRRDPSGSPLSPARASELFIWSRAVPGRCIPGIVFLFPCRSPASPSVGLLDPRPHRHR